MKYYYQQGMEAISHDLQSLYQQRDSLISRNSHRSTVLPLLLLAEQTVYVSASTIHNNSPLIISISGTPSTPSTDISHILRHLSLNLRSFRHPRPICSIAVKESEYTRLSPTAFGGTRNTYLTITARASRVTVALGTYHKPVGC